jgi:hypothetical protein
MRNLRTVIVHALLRPASLRASYLMQAQARPSAGYMIAVSGKADRGISNMHQERHTESRLYGSTVNCVQDQSRASRLPVRHFQARWAGRIVDVERAQTGPKIEEDTTNNR